MKEEGRKLWKNDADDDDHKTKKKRRLRSGKLR